MGSYPNHLVIIDVELRGGLKSDEMFELSGDKIR